MQDHGTEPDKASRTAKRGIGTIIGKIFAGLVMGIVAAVLVMYLFGLIGGEEALGWGMAIGFILVVILALTANGVGQAWGRGALVCGVTCFALPLAGVVFTSVIGAEVLDQAQPDAFSQAGTAIGVGIGGAMVTGILGFVGFFAGVIFIILAFFLLRRKSG